MGRGEGMNEGKEVKEEEEEETDEEEDSTVSYILKIN